MSSGPKVAWAIANRAAEEVVELLRPACERIAIAGSIRRQRIEVGDIEIVAVPAFDERTEGLWGDVAHVDRLEQRITTLRDLDKLALRDVEIHRQDGTVEIGQRNGQSFKALTYDRIPLDLFIVRPPAEWGVLFAIRTGPGDWNEKIVTDCQRFGRRVSGGQVLHLGRPIPCPEEADFFEAVGQPWVEPALRSLGRVAVRQPTRFAA